MLYLFGDFVNSLQKEPEIYIFTNFLTLYLVNYIINILIHRNTKTHEKILQFQSSAIPFRKVRM